MYTTLIEPSELAPYTDDANWAVLDCRFDLSRPDWSTASYAEGHVPNAIYAHLDRDLSSSITLTSGRHPLPQKEAFAATLGRWGIDANVQVIAYDQGNGAYAARLWWLLRWVGHARVAVLNGGFAAWQQAALPVSNQPSTRQPRRFDVRPSVGGPVGDSPVRDSPVGDSVVTTAELEKLVADGALKAGERMLIDARAADRFAGQNETLDPVAGHIPGARNRPFAHNLDPQGRFLPPATLRSRWLETLGGQAPATVIAMCGSGVTACHNLLALEAAGLSGGQLYAGSWSEWIRDRSRPVEP